MTLRYGTPEEAGMSSARIEHVRKLAAGWVASGVTPSLVVLAARRGVIVLHEAFGCLTPEPGSPPLPRDAIFPLASMTKPITATAVIQLVEDGLLGLNRPVQDYIPEFRGEGKAAVMVHHLLTHTSGLREEQILEHVAGKLGVSPLEAFERLVRDTVEEYLLLLYDAPLWKAAGEEMSYCSVNYDLLGEVVRRVSGESLDGFAERRIFDPLGMKDSYYILPEAKAARVVVRPAGVRYAEILNSMEFLAWPSASGGALSTAPDLAIFAQMFLNQGRHGDSRILSPASVAEMKRNQIPGIAAVFQGEFFPEGAWSLGWDVKGPKKALRDGSLHSGRTFAHGCGGGTYMWADPEYELVGVMLAIQVAGGRRRETRNWPQDHFIDAVTAAVVEV